MCSEGEREREGANPTSLIVASGNGGGRREGWLSGFEPREEGRQRGKEGRERGGGEGNCRGRPEKRTNDLVPPLGAIHSLRYALG